LRFAAEGIDGGNDIRIDLARENLFDDVDGRFVGEALALDEIRFQAAFSIARVMALPPPCTTTGLMPTASRKTMSRATPVRTAGSGESMKLPPYLTTKV
jgi:hypothetical protein